MYKEFNLSFKKDSSIENLVDNYYSKGIKLYRPYRSTVRTTLKDFIKPDGSIDATELQEDWFHSIDANVFISHSHKDEKLAIALAGYLYENFGIKSFIDSCVWGYADRLLKIIDDEYCPNKLSNTYSYSKRNLSTSHVHMMLSTALLKMIDKCECLFFLETPESITSYDIIEGGGTKSPWIYAEILMAQMVRQKEPKEHREQILIEKSLNEEYIEKSIQFTYNVDRSHFKNISKIHLDRWSEKYKQNMLMLYGNPFHSIHALDLLYDLINKKVPKLLL